MKWLGPTKHFSIGLIGLLACSFANLVCFGEAPTRRVYPGTEWAEWESAESAGFHDEILMKKLPPLIIDQMNTTGLMVVVDGKVMGMFGDVEELSYIASCRKSVLAMLYGRYVSEGVIDLDATLNELGIDDHQGLLPVEKSATVRHLISARSGVYHPASYPGDDTDRAPKRGSKQPGEYYLYNNWDFNTAGAIFEQLTGVDIYDALETDLAVPLQMQDFDRSAQRKGGNLQVSKYAAYPIWLSTRDMARLGHLMLCDGKWHDQQVLPVGWSNEITRVVTPSNELNHHRQEGMAYGYMWWLWDGEGTAESFRGGYTARGAFGQYITVLPALDMVIAHKTKAAYQRSTRWQDYEKLLRILADARIKNKRPLRLIAE